MKKILNWIGYSVCFLLICLLVYRAIPSTPTAGNAVRWLNNSGLIDKNATVNVEFDAIPFAIKMIVEDENIEVTEYLYNREQYAKKMENAPRPAIYSPYVSVYNKNLEVRINIEKDELYDFEKVIKAQKPILSLKKTFASDNAQQSVKEFKKQDNFVAFVDAFNQIESKEIARKTYKHYFYHQEVTWSGVVIEKEFDQYLTLYGNPQNYKGESISFIRGDFRHYKPLPEQMSYVVFLTLTEKNDLSVLEKGDIVTVKGRVSDYSYQPIDTPEGWVLKDSSILAVRKNKNTNYRLDEKDVYDWFEKSFLMAPRNLTQEKEKSGYITRFQSSNNTIRVTIYSNVQPKKPVHSASEGYEFTYKNVTVWTSDSKEKLETFQKVLKEEKPLKK